MYIRGAERARGKKESGFNPKNMDEAYEMAVQLAKAHGIDPKTIKRPDANST